MMIDRATCIHNLYSDVVNVTKNLETNTYKAFDKDNKEITLDMNAVEAEFAKLDYQTKRMKEYPSLRNLEKLRTRLVSIQKFQYLIIFQNHYLSSTFLY